MTIQGKSDQAVINNIIADFLAKPYDSVTDPLDVLFTNLPPGEVVPLFSVGMSIGSGKFMAALSILWAVCRGCPGVSEFTEEELTSIGAELLSLMNMKATYQPGKDIEDQVEISISKKIRLAKRAHPNPIQLYVAFIRVVSHKKSLGDKRPSNTILADIIKKYNKKQTNSSKISADERDAVLMLSNQLPKFRDDLLKHWLNFPCKDSGVPVSFLANNWLSDLYEPAMNKKTSPRHYDMAKNSLEKNLLWLERCVGKFLDKFKEEKEKGGAINIGSMSSVFRRGNEEEGLYHAVGIFHSFKDEFKKNLSEAAWQEILIKFQRGGLDRELQEKAKAKDESLEVMDFRFIMGAQGYDPNEVAAAAQQAVTMDTARDKKYDAAFHLDELTLKSETDAWDEYLRQLRGFHATGQNALTTYRETVEEAWVTATQEHINAMWPVNVLKTWNELQQSMNTCVNSFADFAEVMQRDVFRVLVFNLSYMGPEHTKLLQDIKSLIEASIAIDDAKTCALVVAPAVAGFKKTYDDDELISCVETLFDTLRRGNLKVREIDLYWNPKTQWSLSRRATHKAFMCISKKMKDNNFVSLFAWSTLWIRGGCSEMINVHPRADCIDPTWQLSKAERGNLGQAQQHKQYVTGNSLYSELAKDIWDGMRLNQKSTAAWLDGMAYDATLPMSIIARSGVPALGTPREMVASFIWNGDTADKKAKENYIVKAIHNTIKTKCKSKEYTIPGAPDLAESSSGVKATKAPTYDERSFKLAKPMADKSLPFRKTFVDKWENSDVPVRFKDMFKAIALQHNTQYNTSGIPWAGETTKRKAEDDAKGAGAKTMEPAEGDPKSISDIEQKHGSVKTKELENNRKSQLVVAKDGTIFLQTGDEPELFLCENALHAYTGEFLVGKTYEKSMKDGGSHP